MPSHFSVSSALLRPLQMVQEVKFEFRLIQLWFRFQTIVTIHFEQSGLLSSRGPLTQGWYVWQLISMEGLWRQWKRIIETV